MQRHLVELTGQHLDGPGQLNLRQIAHLEAVHGHHEGGKDSISRLFFRYLQLAFRCLIVTISMKRC